MATENVPDADDLFNCEACDVNFGNERVILLILNGALSFHNNIIISLSVCVIKVISHE